MKALNQYINEKFQVPKDYKCQYAYHPKTKGELIACIREKIDKEGLGAEDEPLNLNDIDTSKITDMSELFDAIDGQLVELSKTRYFDISDWDVSNAKSMFNMFTGSSFDGNLSDWDVSNVENMHCMFGSSKFTGKNGDISNWNVSKVNDMGHMFEYSKFNGNISNWDVSNVEDMNDMFSCSAFTGKNGDISDWNVKKLKNTYDIFYMCPLQKNPPKWYHKR